MNWFVRGSNCSCVILSELKLRCRGLESAIHCPSDPFNGSNADRRVWHTWLNTDEPGCRCLGRSPLQAISVGPASDCFCGTGNNAGDGYLVAAKLQDRAIDALVVQVGDPKSLAKMPAPRETAARSKQSRSWIGMRFSATGRGKRMCWLMPARTGTTGPAREPFAQAIEWLNTQQAPVIALDVPSGLHPDFGVAEGLWFTLLIP